MSTYVFKAIDFTGSKAAGEVEAESKQAVADQLKQRGLIVLEVADKHKSREIELKFMKSVKAAELAIFSRQLATMMTAGIPLVQSFDNRRIRAIGVMAGVGRPDRECITKHAYRLREVHGRKIGIRGNARGSLTLHDFLASKAAVFAPEQNMRVYGHGIRRRLAPLLGGQRVDAGLG